MMVFLEKLGLDGILRRARSVMVFLDDLGL